MSRVVVVYLLGVDSAGLYRNRLQPQTRGGSGGSSPQQSAAEAAASPNAEYSKVCDLVDSTISMRRLLIRQRAESFLKEWVLIFLSTIAS